MADFLEGIKEGFNGVKNFTDKTKALISFRSTLKDFRQSGDVKDLVNTMVSFMPKDEQIPEEAVLKLVDEVKEWDLNDQALVASRSEVAALKRLVEGYTPYTKMEEDSLLDVVFGKATALSDNINELISSGEILMEYAMQRAEELSVSEVALETQTNKSMA